MKRAFVLLVALPLLSGCGAWGWHQTATLEPSAVQSFLVDPPPSEQPQRYKLTCEATGPLTVYIVAGADAEKARADLQNAKKPSCLTMAQPAHGIKEMVFSVQTDSSIPRFAFILSNEGKESVRATMAAEEWR